MSLQHFIAELKSLVTKWEGEPVIGTVITDVVNAGEAAASYVKANGLQDLYQLALIAVAALAPGASWEGMLVALEAQALADGKTLVKGATAVVSAQAQADLIAAGKLLPPALSAT